MDYRKCQTPTATPAKPGDLPWSLALPSEQEGDSTLSFEIADPRVRRFEGAPLLDRPNSAACALGQYCNVDIAAKTFILVSSVTLPVPFDTRDNVVAETSANLATSNIVFL